MKTSTTRFENDYFSVVQDTDLTQGLDYTFVRFQGPGVRIIVRNSRREIALVRQFRYPLNETTWELPAGGVEPGESNLQAAKRELQEECELTARDWKHVGDMRPLPNVTDFKATLFLAEDLVDSPNLEEKSETQETDLVRFFSSDELMELVREGKLTDEKTLAALTMLTSVDTK